MATSSSTNFELDVAEYIEEAFERCGLEVRTGYDLQSAKRSMNILLADWANRGLNQWTIEQRTQSLTSGTAEYDLGTDVIDILNAVIRRSSTDFTISRISRDQFINIPVKSTTGRPSQYFLDRQITPKLKLWATPENSTDTFVYDALTRIQDADAQVNTMEVPFRFYPCLTAGLAYYIAMKRAPEKIQIMKQIYDEEFDRAAFEDIDSVSSRFLPNRTII